MKRRWMWLCLCGMLACGESEREVSTVTVSGRVKEDALAFAEGVKVEVVRTDGTPAGGESTSDSSGRFSVVAPARSEVYFRCTAPGCAATNSRFYTTGESAVEDVELWIFTLAGRASAGSGAATATGKTADLIQKGLVVGAFHDQGGYAVTGAKADISTSDAETGIAYVNTDGSYGALPFTMGLVVTHQFTAINVPEGEFDLTQDVDQTSARARSVANEVTAVIVPGLPEYCAVIGAVIDENMSVVAGATVEAYDAAGAPLGQTTADDDGFFVLTGFIEGTEFHLRAESGAQYTPSNTRYYETGSEPFMALGVMLVSTTYYDAALAQMNTDLGYTHDGVSNGVLIARLEDRSDALVVGETLSIDKSGDAGYLDSGGAFRNGGGPYDVTQNVADSPQWMAVNVSPGTVVLSQSLDASTVRLPCTAGELTYVGLEELPPRVKITGAVIDETGAAVVGATVSACDEEGTSIDSTTTIALGLFQLSGRILGGSRVSLRIEYSGYRTTNTSYIDLRDSNRGVGNLLLMSDTYFDDTLVADMKTEHGLAGTTGGFIAGALRDKQAILRGPGRVDAAQVSLSPANGIVDYLDKNGNFGNTETHDDSTGPIMFFAVNVDPNDVTVTEDWDSTALECPVRDGEVTLAVFRKLTPQNNLAGSVIEDGNILDPLVGATVTACDEGGSVVGSATTDASGKWRVKGVRAFKRLYLSTEAIGYVTTNSRYYDVEDGDYTGLGAIILPIYSSTFATQIETAWETHSGAAPDTSACGVVLGDLFVGLAKKDGLTAALRGVSQETGYLNDLGEFGMVSSTHAAPKLSGEAAPQFHIFDVASGDYVLEQSGDGKLTRAPVREGEYTYVGVGGITTTVVDISGIVSDGTDPVSGAVVSILDSAYSTVSAPNGSYAFSGVPARSTVAASISKDGGTMNMPYYELGVAAAQTIDLFFFGREGMDLLEGRFETGAGALDAENKAVVFGNVQRGGKPAEGVTVTLSPSAGDVAYFDQYLRVVAPPTLRTEFQFMIGNVEPGDAVFTQDASWQRVEIPCRAGEFTLVSVDLAN